jgi:hypothetical protein
MGIFLTYKGNLYQHLLFSIYKKNPRASSTPGDTGTLSKLTTYD